MAIQLLVQNNSGVVSVKKLQFYENVSDDFFKQTVKLYDRKSIFDFINYFSCSFFFGDYNEYRKRKYDYDLSLYMVVYKNGNMSCMAFLNVYEKSYHLETISDCIVAGKSSNDILLWNKIVSYINRQIETLSKKIKFKRKDDILWL